ncbi:hypothetical protein GCM10007939_18510 [Amylibacter marinus]|uniref:Uncharacterized protein n=1 Tax=Amylibacter marinus TaxID=1475483 RepID=A0ABQ5VWA7_9RHOB|nr:DUF6478 family protein [Amylibacter marinus]GLQ35568.1 hypothetical protein GCM10007939_18510 [Amylibacter marinus]
MKTLFRKVTERFALREHRRYWQRAAESDRATSLSDIAELRRKARKSKAQLEAFDVFAAQRLSLPAIDSNAMRKPQRTTWAYRPGLWAAPLSSYGATSVKNKTSLNPETTIFHDSKINEITLRQIRNRNRKFLSPYALHMDVLTFGGSYLSVMLNMPSDILKNLSKDTLLRVNLLMEIQFPTDVYVRLNLQNGPNHQQVAQQIDPLEPDIALDFDLYSTDFSPENTTAVWLDILFDNPEMNQMILRDLCVFARPRPSI